MIIFWVLLVVGFIFWFVATWPTPVPPYMERIARGFFLAASIVLAWGALTSHA
jgi:uncharacterized membrane protein YiaA